jgi:hypothetical protein
MKDHHLHRRPQAQQVEVVDAESIEHFLLFRASIRPSG